MRTGERVTEPNITMSTSTMDNDVNLFCWLDGFSPKKISVEWYKSNTLLTEKATMNIFESHNNGEKTFNAQQWNEGKEFACKAKHNSKIFNKTWSKCKEPVQKTPTVVIRRNLADILKGDSAILECAARDLPSGELSVTFQANGIRVLEPQYVDLPKGVDTLTARFTVPSTHRNKNQRFTCQIQQSRSIQWTSSSTENLFGKEHLNLNL
ncbi:hypothetical protein AMELA_G00021000 [Ameiurus melas]|uniref:Ig-like domain-containing protein n=1 Tax=Ameiurus melas TaxID=219545 RepID=A0A7J6BBL8_AMEME|nr:hypothetical protein AMELA_G00021000 [Ameiurus melas]